MQNQPRMHPQNTQCPQPQTLQCPQPQNNQHPETQNFQHSPLQNSQQSFDVPDRYAKQIKLQNEWEERIERLNEKYNLDYYSSSESDSDSDPEPDYRYQHKYETLILTIKLLVNHKGIKVKVCYEQLKNFCAMLVVIL